MITLTAEQHKIIDVAFKRFTKFGHEKTTMAQIAEDLGYSRTFLYYYFPDKESILKGAITSRIEKYFQALEKSLKPGMNGFKKVETMLKVKCTCTKDFQALGVYTNMELFKIIVNNPDSDLKQVFQKELKYLTSYISEGVKDGSVRKTDPAKTAKLIIDGLAGYSSITLRRLGYQGKLTARDQENVGKHQLEYATFLLNGLKK